MLSNFLNLFRKDPEKVAEEWYNSKTELMEAFLGQEHNMVMHAIIPYEVGGTLDLYYYPNDINGVGIATKELSRTPKKGSSNKIFKVYELVMFTKHDLDLDSDENSDFGKMHSNISSALNVIARYSGSASLNPHETCEFPAEMEELGGKCFIFDGYKSDGSKRNICCKILYEQ